LGINEKDVIGEIVIVIKLASVDFRAELTAIIYARFHHNHLEPPSVTVIALPYPAAVSRSSFASVDGYQYGRLNEPMRILIAGALSPRDKTVGRQESDQPAGITSRLAE
jgi:hypothetical protein